jgi:hypothetical protein
MPSLPDIELELPTGWKWTQRKKSPLGIAPNTEEGVLQISAPDAGPSWRGADLEPLIRRFVENGRLGQVLKIETGEVPYGPFIRAECISDAHGDVCCWLVVPPTHDPLVITWIGETPTGEGAVARGLVSAIQPGMFSKVVAMATMTPCDELTRTGDIAPVTLLVGNGEITNVMLPFDEDELILHGIRHERARTKADHVARIAIGELRPPGGDRLRLASIYVESEVRWKHFLVPFSTGEIIERSDPPAINGFFEAADPKIAAALDQARR